MAPLNLDNLKLFCDVVRLRSFSRAAEMNQVSQSSVSQIVSQLERRLGVTLLDRSTRPFAVTTEGQLYYEECREIVNRYYSVEARIQSQRKGAAQRVHISAIYSIVLYEMNRVLEQFREVLPAGQAIIRYQHPEEVYESVLTEETDLGLISFARPSRHVETLPWREDPMVLVCPPSHPLAGEDEVSLEELNGLEFVGFDEGLDISKHMDRFLRRQGIEVKAVMAFDNIEFIKRGIESSGAASILPLPTVRNEVAMGRLVVVPVEGLDLVRPLSIIRYRKHALSPAAQAFVEVLQELPGAEASEPAAFVGESVEESISSEGG